MCIALAGIGFGQMLSMAGLGLSAVGQISAAQSNQKMAKYRAKQERMLAEDALERGEQKLEAHRRKVAALAGRQKAVMAAGNLDLSSGSPLDVLGDTAMMGEYDAAVISDNADREARYHETNAGLAEAEGATAGRAGVIGAVSGLFEGGGTMASKWYKPTGRSVDPWAGMR